KSPSFDVGGVGAKDPELTIARQAVDLLRQSDLEVMARDRLVVAERALAQHFVGWTGQRDQENAGPRSVRRRIVVVRRGSLLREHRLATHLDARLWAQIEDQRCAFLGV